VIITASMIVFIVNVVLSLRSGAAAGPNPWDSDTLEWATSSPPGPCSFPDIPVVTSRDGLWEQTGETLVMTGLRTDRREVLVTSLHDAEPESRHELPKDTIWPFLLALGVGGAFIGAVYAPIGLVIGTAITLPIALGWAWPDRPVVPEAVDDIR